MKIGNLVEKVWPGTDARLLKEGTGYKKLSLKVLPFCMRLYTSKLKFVFNERLRG